jgi:transcriptional repressor NrdR
MAAGRRSSATSWVNIALQKRPVNEEQIDQMISGIVRRLENIGEPEIPTSAIGEMVMEALAGLDPVAFIRYASVYKDFKTPADFAAFVASQGEADKE